MYGAVAHAAKIRLTGRTMQNVLLRINVDIGKVLIRENTPDCRKATLPHAISAIKGPATDRYDVRQRERIQKDTEGLQIPAQQREEASHDF